MSVKTIECGECGETVPYGRLAPARHAERCWLPSRVRRRRPSA